MKPVSVGVEVSQPVEQVFDFLDVMANHEPFTNHFLQDFEYSGPDRGVGSKARVRTALGGRSDVIDIEVVDAARPTLIREQNVGAGGKRVGNGTYMLAPLPAGGTQITFQYTWAKAPLSERLAAPLVRAVMRRANTRAMRRLAEQLDALAAG